MWRVPYPATSTQCLAHQFAPDVPFFNAIGQCNQCCWSRAKGSVTPGDVTIEVETSAAPWMWQLGCWTASSYRRDIMKITGWLYFFKDLLVVFLAWLCCLSRSNIFRTLRAKTLLNENDMKFKIWYVWFSSQSLCGSKNQMGLCFVWCRRQSCLKIHCAAR